MSLSGSVTVPLEDGGEVKLRWARNRLHFQPRVFTLSFVGPLEAFTEDAGLIGHLLAEMLETLANHDPLLLRTTLDEDSPLLPALRELGFLLTRSVHVVEFEVEALLHHFNQLPPETDSALRLIPLEEALEATSEEVIMALWLEAYGRTARLDAATPHMLSTAELHESFLGDEELDAGVSVCAFEGGRPAGICPAYRAGTPEKMEFGSVGVAAGSMKRHHEISLAMVQQATRHAATRGVKRLQVEVDSDAPWGLYAFADLPGRVSESFVSLMYVPKWTSLSR